ncbi:MAG: hypothetical protein R2762_14715 [Bryobacteraceae bacterium]
MNTSTNLRFEITSDPALLSLYFALREREYLRIWGVPGLGSPDQFDESGEIVVALDAGRVVGGGRLTMSWPGWRLPMPLEGPEFELRTFLPDLDRHVYAEYSRHVVDAKSENRMAVSHGLALHLFRASAVRGVEIAFSISPKPTMVINRRHARRAGVGFQEFAGAGPLVKDGIEMHLCGYTNLTAALG